MIAAKPGRYRLYYQESEPPGACMALKRNGDEWWDVYGTPTRELVAKVRSHPDGERRLQALLADRVAALVDAAFKEGMFPNLNWEFSPDNWEIVPAVLRDQPLDTPDHAATLGTWHVPHAPAGRTKKGRS